MNKNIWSFGCERRNNIFLYSRSSVIAIYIRVSFTHTGGLGASIILRGLDPNKYLGKLISFLDPVLPTASRTDFVRCWHAKTDGWAASTFHSNCDGRGPTVTIIKVNEYIFGGYTDASWRGGRHTNFFKRGQDKFIPLGFKGGGGEGAGGNIKRCSFDTSSKPLFFHISVLAIKISSHQCRL